MRSPQRPGRRGVTLLELLIAVTLVSLLSVGMLMAMRVGLDAMEKTNSRFTTNRRVLGAQRVLYQQVAGMIPVSSKCGPGNPLYFQGTPTSMRFVSSYSLEEASRGYPRILEYAVIQGERGAGVRLVVRETFYTGPMSLAPFCVGAPVQAGIGGPSWFVLADKLAYCRLAYQIRDVRNPSSSAVSGRAWAHVFDGKVPPTAVRFEMAPLTPEPGRLQIAGMTVPVRLTLDPSVKYKDIEDEPTPQ